MLSLHWDPGYIQGINATAAMELVPLLCPQGLSLDSKDLGSLSCPEGINCFLSNHPGEGSHQEVCLVEQNYLLFTFLTCFVHPRSRKSCRDLGFLSSEDNALL